MSCAGFIGLSISHHARVFCAPSSSHFGNKLPRIHARSRRANASGGNEDHRLSQNLHMSSRQDFGTSASDEISAYVSEHLEFGPVTSMRREGSSGWAVMHKADTESGKSLFIKVSRGDEMMFAGEAEGLKAMFATRTVRVPNVYYYGALRSGKGSFIVMENLSMDTIVSQSMLGDAIGRLHQAEPSAQKAQQGKFGFTVDNTIGETAQPNGWMDQWIDFYRERRLRHQLLLTGDSELIRLGDRLCNKLEEFFVDVGEIKPCLLHGDLWSGNINSVDGEPVIFDPSCYYGHHEAEFGMSWCAGLNRNFWDAYHERIPRAPGFKERHDLYQLYHYLNHYNLFGGGYRAMAESILNRLT